MSLKEIAHHIILTDVLKPLFGKKNTWKVFIVDATSVQILSSCCSMTDLTTRGITLIEQISKRRQCVPSLEAIYFLTPSRQSLSCLMEDFYSSPMYKSAHVFFTEPCPDTLFSQLAVSPSAKYIKTLKELNVAFKALESQVFTITSPLAFRMHFDNVAHTAQRENLEMMATKIASLCAALGEFPSIRYRASHDPNMELACLVERRLAAFKAEDSSLGMNRTGSQLLILDRAMDPISPLLHEMTLQAMASELLNLHDDVYKYDIGNVKKEVVLNEDDCFWRVNRHRHIADVLPAISEAVKKFVVNKVAMTAVDQNQSQPPMELKALSSLVKTAPQYQKEVNMLSGQLHMVESCMEKYRHGVDRLNAVEQDLVIDTTEDPIRSILPLLMDETVDVVDKLRLILIYIHKMNGIERESLDKLVFHAKLDSDCVKALRNTTMLGQNVEIDGGRARVWRPNRRERDQTNVYRSGRWVPVVKDIMEDVVEGKLDETHFPFLADRKVSEGHHRAARSARFGEKHSLREPPSRLIVFIVGGMTHSEVRSAYETSNEHRPWQVIVGSDQVLTPSIYINNLKALSEKEDCSASVSVYPNTSTARFASDVVSIC